MPVPPALLEGAADLPRGPAAAGAEAEQPTGGMPFPRRVDAAGLSVVPRAQPCVGPALFTRLSPSRRMGVRGGRGWRRSEGGGHVIAWTTACARQSDKPVEAMAPHR